MNRFDMDFVKRAVTGICMNCTKDILLDAVSTDSKKCRTGTLFIPLKGERFDGHDFIDEAAAAGASAFIYSKKQKSCLPGMLVEDTLSAYHELASAYMETLSVHRTAITGSNGKTSTKDLLFSCFKTNSGALKTAGNTNNLIGAPANIFRADSSTKYMILEMGMNTQGELRRLSSVYKPDTVIITNINNSHIGNFTCFEDLAAAKFEILTYMDADGLLIINGDDSAVLKMVPQDIKVKTFGMKQTNDYYPVNVEMNKDGSYVTMKDGVFKISVPGSGAVYSFLAVYAFAMEHPSFPVSLKEGLESFTPPSNRMNIVNTGTITIIDDTYNASPSSARNALDVLSRFECRKIAVLGDMLELGADSEALHEETGRFASEKGIDVLFAFGKAAEAYTRYFKGKKFIFSDREGMHRELKNEVKKNDAILVKGSRMMKMEETVNFLKESYSAI